MRIKENHPKIAPVNPEFYNIIVRMPNWLGDAVMALPILTDLKREWPQATLTAMCQGAVGTLLKGNPDVDEIFTFTKSHEFLRRGKNRDLITRLRQGKYDLGILLPNSFSSAWLFWRGKVKNRIGFASDLRGFLLTYPTPFPKERGNEHLVNTYKRILEPLGIPRSRTAPRLYVTDEERIAATQILRQHHILKDAAIVGVNPGAAYGSAKCWLPDRFREIISRLAKRPHTYVICFSDTAGSGLVHHICHGMPPNVVNLAAKTNLRELIALIQQCTVFLTNDSGPMHIAAALKTPLIALFGSTHEIATGPYQHGELIHKHVPCSPCYKRTCPIVGFPCMTQITTDEVYAAIMRYL